MTHLHLGVILFQILDKQIKIWDVSTGQCNITVQHHTDKVRISIVLLWSCVFEFIHSNLHQQWSVHEHECKQALRHLTFTFCWILYIKSEKSKFEHFHINWFDLFFFFRMKSIIINPSRKEYGLMVNYYTRRGDMNGAREIFENMRAREIEPWSHVYTK